MEILLYTLAKDRLTDGIIPIFRELGTLKFLIRQLDCIYAKIASWTTIVVHSRDDKEVGVAHGVKSPENQPQFSQTTMG